MRIVRGFSRVTTAGVLHAAILVVLVVAFVTSFRSGSTGAGLLGYDPAFTSSLPLVCDVVAGAATVIHARVRRDKEMRRLAAWFVLVPMAASWAANAVDHINRAGAAADHWPAVGRWAWLIGVVVGAGLCPAAVAGLLHLSTRFGEWQAKQVKRPAAPWAEAAKAPEVDDEVAQRRAKASADRAERRRRAAQRKAAGDG